MVVFGCARRAWNVRWFCIWRFYQVRFPLEMFDVGLCKVM